MILIVGATGYIGRYLCPYLQEKGYEVLALGRSEKVRKFFDHFEVPFQYFDMKEEASYKNLPKQNIEAVIDLSACLAEHETPVRSFFDINTLGVYRLLEFVRQNDIRKFILTSSHKVYNDIRKDILSEADGISFRGDHSPYIISKVAAEYFVEYYNKDFGLEGIVLRLTGVHGYGEILGHLNADGSYKKSTFEIFFEKALKGERIEVWGDQSVKRDHIYIKDVLSAIEASVRAKGKQGIFNIATGKGISQYEEACALAKVFGRDKVSEVVVCPEKPGLTRGYIYDVSKACEELGWVPCFTDPVMMYKDYKQEWEKKVYRNYHYIQEGQMPMSL
ncbi:NAD-dependent epimerase/dehydratase family protein [Parabacteroides pacaensis]|uniref:NAD-dependent epimerase/dehydratase family protein n=1 Tax=Parabacteroides pacaensis TaxID=2086575 RepID=UPI000D0FBCCD|nr:NAD(P)-dependent oxidoreductase [Parabacteroides pacaensis]